MRIALAAVFAAAWFGCSAPQPPPAGVALKPRSVTTAACGKAGDVIVPSSLPQLTAGLLGQWVYCSGFEMGGARHAGIELASSGEWYFLDRGAAGALVRRKGFEGGGRWSLTDTTMMNGPRFHAQLNLDTTHGTYIRIVFFQRSPDALRLEGGDESTTYVPVPGHTLAAAVKEPSAPPVVDSIPLQLDCQTLSSRVSADPPANVDYIAHRFESMTDRFASRVSLERGKVCANAKSAVGCVAAVKKMRLLRVTKSQCQTTMETLRPAACQADYYVYTRGDEVGMARTYDELRSLLGRIDTREKAELLLESRYGNVCVSAYDGSGGDHRFQYAYDCTPATPDGHLHSLQMADDGLVRERVVPSPPNLKFPCSRPAPVTTLQDAMRGAARSRGHAAPLD